ncbi:hypothetical protein CP960_06900 [Malaciobacter halophilus]|uniref:Uncharacterized protein n=1 Tax=Malaciobacter halophilus TaxID=197482 RepID=A0A2N1J324_9BACT|nr:hypothetical protein [Malaciobacter halophilus]AXH10597.1 hypothetical protein AHALO_2267 [Malaciobacter halophilus]PKI80959.1 hypothetical protein CP960_06900 [Malaciobacter halophilus]
MLNILKNFINSFNFRKKEFKEIGFDINIDENNGSSAIVFPQYTREELTIEDLSDDLSNISSVTTDYLIKKLRKYAHVFEKYDLSIVVNENKSSSPYVFKTIFPESIIEGVFVPVIGQKGIHTINKETLQNISTVPKLFDYTVMLDSNIVSKAETYFTNKIGTFCDSFQHIESKQLNYDPSPYLIEQLLEGYEKNGDNYRLNKKDKNIAGLVQNVRVVHKNLHFKIKDEEKYINNFIKELNIMAKSLFRYYNINKLSLIYILEARALFTTKQEVKRKRHVLESLTNNDLPIGFRVLKLMSLFFKDDNYSFFGKVRNFNNETDFINDLNNTARDLLICTLPSIMNSSNLFPILYTDDRPLRKAYEDLQPDLILHIGEFNQVSHIYLDILEEYHKNKKFKDFFTEENNEKRIKSSRNPNILFSDKIKEAKNNLIKLLKEKSSKKKNK